MKKVLSLILALAMVFALVACGEKQPASDGDASSDGDKPARGNVIMTFGTADTGGSMYPAGAAVSQVWTNNVQGVKCNTQTSTGSFQNCQDVSTGEVDVAVATSDVVLNAYNGTGKFADIGKLDNLRVIGAVYTSVLSGVALKSSGLTYIHDLLGKRVAVGPAASATENATLAAFDAMGIDSSNTSLENLGLGDGADSVGILDAAFGFAGLPIGGQLNLAATKEIQVLDMTQEEIDKVLAGNAAYIQTKIPAGTYTGQDNDANTFGVKCLIIVTADMDADLVYDLCKAMNEHTEELAAGNALLKDMTDPSFLCTQMPIPLHDGAQKYYSEQGLI